MELNKQIRILNNSLLDLWPILNQWLINIETFTKAHTVEGYCLDVPYWYEERPNVGVLAAAAWQTNNHALEAYSARHKDQKTGKMKPIRPDLCIIADQAKYMFSAKHLLLNITHTDENLNEIKQELEKASADARKYEGEIDDTEVGYLLGLLFIVPQFDCKSITTFEEKTPELLYQIRNLKPDLLATAFWNDPKFCEETTEEIYYPGVILLGEIVYPKL